MADQLEDVLTVELPVHQDIIDVNDVLSRIKQVLDDLLVLLASLYRPHIKDERDCITD